MAWRPSKLTRFSEAGELARNNILIFIENFISQYGFSPSFTEIRDGANIASVSTVKYHLDVLREKGIITFLDNKSRTIRFVDVKK